MKKWILLLLLTAFAWTLYAQQPAQRKATVAVLDFKLISGLTKEEVAALTSKFRTSLAKTNTYDVLERTNMDAILQEQNFTLTDACNTDECVIQIGKLLSAEKIINGDIGRLGDTYTINVKMINVTTGRIELVENQEYEGKLDGLLQVFDDLARKMAGTYDDGSSWVWWVGGAAIIGGGAAAAVLLGGKSSSGGSTTPTATIKNPTFPGTP
ncbi:MAG: CsgG/HfaB family protein [Bacteroidetes bacterium]|nr:CsgG/HfaB family protein [Bacteroidota bacterium]